LCQNLNYGTSLLNYNSDRVQNPVRVWGNSITQIIKVIKMHYFAIYKPFMMISQFTPENEGDITLADLDFDFPKDCYTIGRLDKDSEGLLLLTNDNQLKNKVLDPKFKSSKTYWAQVEGLPTPEAIQELERGVIISINGKKHKTLPAKASVLENEPDLPERNPPIRYRAAIPTAWIQLTITEGKNRQVRRMCAAVGLPVLRLVRFAIGDLTLQDVDNERVTYFKKELIYGKVL
jgi:23S rRNA pseudouridine2457 synthase